MIFKNTTNSYGWVSIALHWITAITVVCLFGVRLWMVGFIYDHPLYKTVPHLHRSIGFCLICLVVFRLLWRFSVGVPKSLTHHATWEKVLANVAHTALYLGLLRMLPTGYLMSTAKGQSLDVFTWFSIPALFTGVDNLEDIAGEIHEWLAFTIIGVACIHALGALKHHFIDRDSTLLRMLRPSQTVKNDES